MDKNREQMDKQTSRGEQQDNSNKKQEQLDQFRIDDTKGDLTTNQGLKMSEDEFSLKAGERGPTLMEDFHFREKMTHFDHERIPERVVHARGFGAHGVFEAYGTAEPYSKAKFLKKGKKTPVFVRFSTVQGFRGSNDTVRDTRGFATKFYTEEGNYDFVANNMPVFFIQDAIKFPDVVHAIKPEPRNEIPQATAAHNTFWDFVANNTESAHHVIWNMSPRALPRSYRMMEGFGVHTFRFVNDEGKGTFVKMFWKPKLGAHSLVFEEAQMIAGNDPDFNRKDLFEAIEGGNYPEWELGVQLIPEEDEHKFDFDLLDPTKLVPEEDVPVTPIGKMTLNRNVDNHFAETEQVAFHPGHVVPGIDFTNDPLLQGRLFSYTDTQLIRLGGPNFHELPINRPINGFTNHQRDGYNRIAINTSNTAYRHNSINNNKPDVASPEDGGYEHYQEKVEGRKVRARSDSFKDHYTQVKLFWNSMSKREKDHIVSAYSFELGKCDMPIREMNIKVLSNVDLELAQRIAKNIGVTPPESGGLDYDKSSPALSQDNTPHMPDTLKVGVLIDDGFNDEEVQRHLEAFASANLQSVIVSEDQNPVKGANGTELEVEHTFDTTDAVLLDALYVVGGPDLSKDFVKETVKFLQKAFDHFKPIGATQAGIPFLREGNMLDHEGVITTENTNDFSTDFIEAMTKHRFWYREV
ncbi:catalase [Alkalibacterium iburiense]|uniref:Catalase n=1 Tax=Alkalibacterium iburiense TaxID=290589 RepID=A0ABP3H2X7_9LACT